MSICKGERGREREGARERERESGHRAWEAAERAEATLATPSCEDANVLTRARAHTQAHTQTHNTHARAHARTHAREFARASTHAHTHTRTRTHKTQHTHTRTHAHTHTHTHNPRSWGGELYSSMPAEPGGGGRCAPSGGSGGFNGWGVFKAGCGDTGASSL